MINLPELEIKNILDSTFNTSSNFLFYLNQLNITSDIYNQVKTYNQENKTEVIMNFPFNYAFPSSTYLILNLEENGLVDQIIGNKTSDGTYVIYPKTTSSYLIYQNANISIPGIIDNNNITIDPNYNYIYSYDKTMNTSSLLFNDPNLTTSTNVNIVYQSISVTPSVYQAFFKYGYSIYISTQNEAILEIYYYIVKTLFYTNILYYLNSLSAYNIEYNFEPFTAEEQELPVNIYTRRFRLSFVLPETFELSPGIDSYTSDNPMLDNSTLVTSINSSITSSISSY